MKQAKIEDSEDEIEDIFKQYLDICNQAIEKHKDEFPYREALGLSKTVLGEKTFDLAIYDDNPRGTFSLKFKDKELIKSGQPANPKKAWWVNLSYLKNVVENPKKYIEHPEKLDFDWLRSRLGL